jgi:hypothetical protein
MFSTGYLRLFGQALCGPQRALWVSEESISKRILTHPASVPGHGFGQLKYKQKQIGDGK